MAAELRDYADRLEMRLGAVRRAADELDPPRAAAAKETRPKC